MAVRYVLARTLRATLPELFGRIQYSIKQPKNPVVWAKGRDKGRVKFNYLTSEQLRSLKYKSNNGKSSFQSGTKK